MTSARVNHFLNTTLKEIMSILNAECGSLFLFDSQKKELVLDSYLNSRIANLSNVKRRVGEGVSGKVVEIKSPVLVRDIDLDPRFDRNGYNHYQTKSFISIPLFCCDELIGLINITDKSSGEAFSEKDLQFAATLCRYACAIVEQMPSFPSAEEREKKEKQKQLLEKYASVGKLAAGVVHEINNPLDGIIRYTNMLFNQIDVHSPAKDYLLEMKKGLERISNITGSLLEFSHIVNSDPPRFKKYVHLSEVIEEALDVVKGKLNGNIRLVKHYDSSLPRVLDMGLYHILVNIIVNAIDAMPEGGTLEIATQRKDEVVHISFKDTGTGIDPEIKERIFEPFFTTKEVRKGTGLGLAICKEIVKKYEGAIEVQSAAGAGSTFNVLIPARYLENAQ